MRIIAASILAARIAEGVRSRGQAERRGDVNWSMLHAVAAPAAALIAALLTGALVLRWVLARCRSDDGEGRGSLDELRTKLRELHAGGGLSDEEYRTIETKLADGLPPDINGSSRDS